MCESVPENQTLQTIKQSNNIVFTFKAWPVIAGATIGLCFLTQAVAKLFGIELPDQANIDLVRQWGLHCFDSLKNFGVFAGLVAQVLLLMPAIEELLFRWLLFGLPVRLFSRSSASDGRQTTGGTWVSILGPRPVSLVSVATFSAALFSAAHYIAQPWPDAAFLALFFFGFAQCWLYRRTGRLWCAMLNHALFNLTNLVLLFLIPA